MVLGVRLQVLGELPDPSVGKRDLDFRRSRVLLSASVLRDQLAFDFRSCCQTAGKYTSGAISAVRTRISRLHRIADQRRRARSRGPRSGSRGGGPTRGVLAG